MNEFRTICLIGAVLGLVTTLDPVHVSAAEKAREYHILIDLHLENPVVNNQKFNRVAAKRLASWASGLKLRYLDTVIIHSFGEASRLAHLDPRFNASLQLTYRGYQPAAIPDFLRKRVLELPNTEKHTTSDLTWKLADISRDFQCGTRDTHVLVISDGAHFGTWDGRVFSMIDIAGTPFTGCRSITFMGFGTAASRESRSRYDAARRLLEGFAANKGFENVKFIR